MSRSLERRIERLERGAHVGADVERARAIFDAYTIIRDHPEQATDEDRALAEDWQRALVILINAEGGLEAVLEDIIRDRGRREMSASE